MQPRRSLRLVAGALVLALPLLGSCGFDKATDRVYTPAAGVNDRDGDVDVLSAVIVSAQADSGTFIASMSNNLAKADDSRTLTSVAGAGDWSDLTVDPSDLSVEIPPRGFVNLVDEDPITVRGDFTPGEVAQLTLTFDSGDSVTMDVPVVYACNYYEGLDSSASEESESAGPSDSPSPGEVSESPSDSPSASSSASSSTSSSESASPGEPYSCSAVGEG
jgi:hypothetical protein